MFGIFRFILAYMVVVDHLAPSISNWAGAYAVFSFYIISGYLMTMVLNRTYGFSLTGITRFLTNRFLRIYPTYYVALLFGFAVIAFLPLYAQAINIALRFPSTSIEWLHNLLIFGLLYDASRMVPPAWSLYVELVFYVAMSLILVRERRIVLGWFALSFFYTAYLIATGASFSDRYYPPFAASLPFSIGAVIYFYRDAFHLNSRWHIWIASILYITNLFLARQLWGNPDEYSLRYSAGLYLQVLIAAYLTAVLSKARTNLEWIRGTDRLLGDLAYPVFVCHYQVATVVSWLGGSMTDRVLLIRSAVLIFLTAFLIHFTVEQIIKKLRDKIRPRSNAIPLTAETSAIKI